MVMAVFLVLVFICLFEIFGEIMNNEKVNDVWQIKVLQEVVYTATFVEEINAEEAINRFKIDDYDDIIDIEHGNTIKILNSY